MHNLVQKAGAESAEVYELNPFGTRHGQEDVAGSFSAFTLMGEAVEPDDFIFEDSKGHGCLSTSDFYQIFGGTGSGKTLFTLSMAVSVAAGKSFIGWPCAKPRKVLYLDGELPQKTMRKRLELAAKLTDEERVLMDQNLVIVSRERLLKEWNVDLAPLDTVRGQEQVLWLVDAVGAELVVLDSRFCLLDADMKEGNSMPKNLILALRHRKVAQWWVHHTGKDGSRGGYGDKTAEFLMDANIHFEQTDEGFQMFFSGEKGGKARNKEPDNAHFYSDLKLRFNEGIWTSNGTAILPKNSNRRDSDVSMVLKGINALVSNRLSSDSHIKRESLKEWLLNSGAYEPEDGKLSDADKKAVNRAIKGLIDDNRLRGSKEELWLPRK